jgi:hypothetical protein
MEDVCALADHANNSVQLTAIQCAAALRISNRKVRKPSKAGNQFPSIVLGFVPKQILASNAKI